jgi:tetratricopeptide (TPR) repeat protein
MAELGRTHGLVVLAAMGLGSCAQPVSPPPKMVTPIAHVPVAPAAPAADDPVATWARGAQLFVDLGPLHRAVTTKVPEAQAYFDQGLKLTYGFNHDEATRSFAKAAVLDPSCASCFWGVALTLGPNYNVPMLPDRARAAWVALEAARAQAAHATPVEQALVAALGKRYKGPEPLEPPAMQPFNEAYAAAMRQVAQQFPDDLDVQVLFAESLMDVNPWKLWDKEGKPGVGTDEIVSALETTLKKAPEHPGANHYYIHAIEASLHPERAEPSADRLAALMPGAGHVVHMPAHIYQRVGRYADASAANRKAVEADLAYLQKTRPPGYYPMYLGHNYGFLAYSAAMEGRMAETLASARGSAKAVPPEMLDMMPGMDFFASEPLLAMVRFARWDELLAEPKPPEKYLVMTALWLHGHGMALVAKGRLDEAQQDLAAIQSLGLKLPPDLTAGQNPAQNVLQVAARVLEARLAEGRKAAPAAVIALWKAAVEREDALMYSEPADWFYPVRHYLGAVLLTAGRAKEAEAVYREDLRRNPHNGWSLFGVRQSLKAQGKRAEAQKAQQEFNAAWKNADITLTASRL